MLNHFNGSAVVTLHVIIQRVEVFNPYRRSISYRFKEGDLTRHLIIIVADVHEEVQSLKEPRDREVVMLHHE